MLRAEHQQDSEDLFRKIVQASQVRRRGMPRSPNIHLSSVLPWVLLGC